MVSGCGLPELKSDTISGHVYLDGKTVPGALVEAVSADGIDRRNTTTDDAGAYTLRIKTETWYNLTAAYKGLHHTVWPVYMPGESHLYDIGLMARPRSAIEGAGYAWGGHSPWAGHMIWSGVVVNMTSVKGHSTITALTDRNGYYSLEVEPNVLYNLTGASCLENKYPIPLFHYRNTDTYFGSDHQLMVGPNETVLIDYEIRLP
jgi:hypothetical protein